MTAYSTCIPDLFSRREHSSVKLIPEVQLLTFKIRFDMYDRSRGKKTIIIDQFEEESQMIYHYHPLSLSTVGESDASPMRMTCTMAVLHTESAAVV